MLEELLADISLVSHKLAVEFLDESFVFQRLSVISVAWRYTEVQDFPTFIADEMQLESEEPAH